MITTSVELDVATYAACERRAMACLSNDHIRAFSAATFAFHGYPAAAELDAAVVRFVDTMQELNDPRRHYETELYSEDEAELIERVNSAVLAETKRAFGRAIRPWMGPLAAIKPFRAVQAICVGTGRERLRVFEIGPGSGYLGALLIAHGHQYYSTDIAQGFYLWQSRLMRALAATDFLEGAHQERWPYQQSSRAIHMPWWDYATLYRSEPPAVDVIVCDHALGEMNPYALRYIAQMSKNMLSESPLGFVMGTSIGEPRFNDEETVRLNFDRVGMKRAVSNNLFLFAITHRPLAPAILELADSVPLYNPRQSSTRLKGRDFIPVRTEEAPVSYAFYEFLGFDVPNDSQAEVSDVPTVPELEPSKVPQSQVFDLPSSQILKVPQSRISHLIKALWRVAGQHLR